MINMLRLYFFIGTIRLRRLMPRAARRPRARSLRQPLSLRRCFPQRRQPRRRRLLRRLLSRRQTLAPAVQGPQAQALFTMVAGSNGLDPRDREVRRQIIRAVHHQDHERLLLLGAIEKTQPIENLTGDAAKRDLVPNQLKTVTIRTWDWVLASSLWMAPSVHKRKLW